MSNFRPRRRSGSVLLLIIVGLLAVGTAVGFWVGGSSEPSHRTTLASTGQITRDDASAASVGKAIAAFKKEGIDLRADLLPIANANCKKLRASGGGIVYRRSCWSIALYAGEGTPPPFPTHALRPTARSTDHFAIYVYGSVDDAWQVVSRNGANYADPLTGRRVTLFRGRNVVVMCVDCSGSLSRIKSVLIDL
jgi:hypothetical protein